MVLRRFIENDKYEKKHLKNLLRDESNLPTSSTEFLQEAPEMEDEGIQLADEKKSNRKSEEST